MNIEPAIKQQKAVFGMLSLIAFGVGIFAGAAEMIFGAEMSGLKGITFILLASAPSLLFAVIGLLRKEKPLWPAILGFLLSIIPGGLGLLELVGFYAHLL
jgi:hypothetical protein